jgi:hypothetical protein
MTHSPTSFSSEPLPSVIHDPQHLDELLSAPTPGVVETLARHEGDLIVLGAAGKMGPTLTRMAQRATQIAGTKRRIIAISRFSAAHSEAEFHEYGIETIRCDLLQQSELDALPEAPNVVFMAGMKFGSTGNEPLTWAMNSYLPGMVCHKFRRSKIVSFGTGNVYPLSPLALGGSVESDPPGPVGEYAMSCLGRERIFAHFSQAWDIPLAILRLNYAIAIRYGVLVDVANKVWTEKPISLTMGVVNVIWQGDANAMALQAFDCVASPPCIVNLAGPEQLSIRRIAMQFGALMGKTPVFDGEEAPSALLSNGQRGHRLFGYPCVGVEQMITWIADWVQRGGESLGKPTHFETRDGKF